MQVYAIFVLTALVCLVNAEDSNQVCGESHMPPNFNETCVKSFWEKAPINRQVNIMEGCLSELPEDVKKLHKKINIFKDAVKNLTDCYYYSEDNKNYIEFAKRLLKVGGAMQAVMANVVGSQVPLRVQDCFVTVSVVGENILTEYRQCASK